MLSADLHSEESRDFVAVLAQALLPLMDEALHAPMPVDPARGEAA
jgi:hypothetical protein